MPCIHLVIYNINCGLSRCTGSFGVVVAGSAGPVPMPLSHCPFNSMRVVHWQNICLKLQILSYKCSPQEDLPGWFTDALYKADTCIHHTKDYQSGLTNVPYKTVTYVHDTKNYLGNLLILVTCENILIERKEHWER